MTLTILFAAINPVVMVVAAPTPMQNEPSTR
jgi:hypothetical protein